MGSTGARPVPTRLRLVGGAQASKLNHDEPQPRALPPAAPAWLSEGAAREWERVVPDLTEMGLAYESDAACLGAYCEAVARLQAASDIVTRAGLLLRDPVRKNPAVGQARDASYEVRMWAREFGLTPSARASLHAADADADADLPPERLLS